MNRVDNRYIDTASASRRFTYIYGNGWCPSTHRDLYWYPAHSELYARRQQLQITIDFHYPRKMPVCTEARVYAADPAGPNLNEP